MEVLVTKSLYRFSRIAVDLDGERTTELDISLIMVHSMDICLDPDDFMAWQKGKLIQDAMPYLSPAEREFLVTGMAPIEWQNVDKRIYND
jgi:hypothetical protein